MKNIILLIGLLISTLSFSQVQNSNPYQESENGTTTTEAKLEGGNNTSKGPGNPGEPVPINDYIPILLSVGLGIIFFTERRKTLN